MDFKETIEHISKQLKKVPYDNGDISDIGNEVGFAIGSKIINMTEEQIEDFITGFRHGISLTNKTH